MAETPSKRPRDEETQVVEDSEETKRHKSYNHILSLLEDEEDESTQDLSSLITTLQNELSSDSLSCPTKAEQENPKNIEAAAIEDYTSASSSSFNEDDDKERVIRHLLQASDDELGIPNREEDVEVVVSRGSVEEYGDVEDGAGGLINVNGGFSIYDDGLWEIEDANATYYTFMQSELFM